jgi:hypothetical protein
MWEDPILADVHRTREKLAAAYNFDVTAYFADLRERQAALGERLVHQKKRAEATDDQGGNSGTPGSASSGSTDAASK